MKNSKLIILIVAIALIGAGAVYVFSNMGEGDQQASQTEEQGFGTDSQTGEPLAVPEQNDTQATPEGGHDGYLDHEHADIVMGEKAPDFTLLDMDGNLPDLFTQLHRDLCRFIRYVGSLDDFHKFHNQGRVEEVQVADLGGTLGSVGDLGTDDH